MLSFMKFDELFPAAKIDEMVSHNQSSLRLESQAASCVVCSADTIWFDTNFQSPVCGEECHKEIWRRYNDANSKAIMGAHIHKFRAEIMEELENAQACEDQLKDILIVVHDQYDFVKLCLNSVFERTSNFRLYIWDNGSQEETASYLRSVQEANPDLVTLVRSEENIGFLEPNNKLIEMGTGAYFILLNSDTQVFTGWDTSMIGYLQKHQDVAQVGYLGGLLREDGRGEGGDFGDQIDYVSGFCFCCARETYREFGLFSPDYRFAYFEDSDFSLRLKAAGKQIYALHLLLVHHYQNKTVIAVEKEGTIDLAASFAYNQNLFTTRWEGYLKNDRVQVKTDSSSG
jgi:hypothetical protein